MISRLVVGLFLIAFIGAVGGFVVFAVWDVPVTQAPVEKTLDNSRFLESNS